MHDKVINAIHEDRGIGLRGLRFRVRSGAPVQELGQLRLLILRDPSAQAFDSAGADPRIDPPSDPAPRPG